jgi:hypothetical protein
MSLLLNIAQILSLLESGGFLLYFIFTTTEKAG